MNVLPLVNKGLALFQWKGDIQAAEQCVSEAVTIDSDSEAAVATLAQLKLQQNRIDEAVKLFEKQVELARSEPELVSALTYKYVSPLSSTVAQHNLLTLCTTGVFGPAPVHQGFP